MKLAIIFNRVGPYHDARLRALSKNFEVICIEECKKDTVYAWNVLRASSKYKKVSLFADEGYLNYSPKVIRRTVFNQLDLIKPSRVAIAGWSSKICLASLMWCLDRKVPSILLSASTENDFKRTPLKEFIKSRILDCFQTAVVGGTKQKEYLEKLGFDPDMIQLGYDCVDNTYFHKKANKSRNHELKYRKLFGLPNNYFLASGRLIPKKNLQFLLRSYSEYVLRSKKPWSLIIIGDGPEKEKLSSLIKKLNIEHFVLRPGFIQYSSLPIYYGLSKAFIHCSTSEQWGLVVNEAMAASLPVLVSNHCGCSVDLVEEGENGYTFSPSNIQELVSLMLRLSEDKDLLKILGRKSFHLIQSWSPQVFLKSMLRACNHAKNPPGQRKPLLGKLFTEIMISFPFSIQKRDF